MLKEAGKIWAGWLMVTLLVAAFSYGVGVWSAPVTSFGIDGSGNLDVNGVESNTLRIAALTSGRIPISGTNGLIGDDTDLTWSGGNTLNSPQIAISGLTAGRITFTGVGGLLSDSATLIFNATTDTLTATNFVASTVAAGALTAEQITVDNIADIIINGVTLETYINQQIAEALEGYIPTPPGPDPSASNWTFWKVGTNYWAKDEDAGTNSTSANFGSLFNTAQASFSPGDLVTILDGTYYVTTIPTLTATNVTITGSTATIIKAATGSTAELFFIQGTSNVVEWITFDDNLIRGTSGAVYIKGTDNTLANCTLQNCNRYGLVLSQALRAHIVNNTVTRAQYCIAGAQNTANVDCIIEGNTLSGMILYGIKMKSMDNCTVQYNKIDTNPSISPGFIPGDTEYSKRGITIDDLYAGTYPVVDCTIQYNNITQSGAQGPLRSMTTTAFLGGGPDTTGNTHDNVITGNIFSGQATGVRLNYGGTTPPMYNIHDNTYTNLDTKILNYGTTNVISEPTIPFYAP